MLKFLLILSLIYNLTNCDVIEEIQVVKDLAGTFKKTPFFIISGYERQEGIQWIHLLSESGYQSKTYNFNSLRKLPRITPELNCVFILNLNYINSSDILKKANNNTLFRFPFKWIILNFEASQNGSFLSQFEGLNMLVNSEIYIINKLDADVSIAQVYKTHQDRPIIWENFGKWDLQTGLRRNDFNKITAVRRKNLMNITLRTSIVITHNDSLNHLTDYRDKHIDSITKVNYILVQHLANTVNATLSYTIEDSWGYRNNSKWTGMIGELTEDHADIGGTPLFVTTDRIDIIDYIAMTTATKSNFVFRQPKLSYVTNVFTLPFHWTVWLSTAALILINTIGLAVILRWEQVSRAEDEHLDLEAQDAVLISIGATCQQGTSSVPDKLSGRILTLFIFVSLMFLYTSYSANIVALLQSSSNSIKTLEDLLKSRITVGVDDTVFNRFYFPAATEPIRRALFLQKVQPPHQRPRYFTIEEGVRRIRQGLFAFHMEGGSGYKLVSETFYEHQKCDLQEISFLQVPDPWLAIQKNSSYKEMLKIGLRKIQESGIQSREVSRIYTKKPQCHGSGSSFVSVGLIDIYSAVVVFAIGFLVSIFVFILELLMYKRKQRKQK